MPLIIATNLRDEGVTGVHTHVRQLQLYLGERGLTAMVVTPFSWKRYLAPPVFGVSSVLRRFSGSATVAWYLYWHEAFLRNALRLRLAEVGECVVYAQSPTAARAALQARSGRHQRVVMAVHFMTSYSNEFTPDYLKRGGTVFQAIRRAELQTIPQVDGIVYVSTSARNALLAWLPEAASVPSAVINNFIAASPSAPIPQAIGDLVSIGALRPLKNHGFLLQVLVEAKRAGHSVTLDVFGDGPDRKELSQLTRSLGLEDQVHWRGFRRDARDFLSGYKVYVHASHSEAMPLAIIEAMAAGLPIIAGNVGGISDLGDNGREVRFWPLDDPVKAAAILIELLACEPARLNAASAAAARFRCEFDAHVLGAQLLSFLLDSTLAAQ